MVEQTKDAIEPVKLLEHNFKLAETMHNTWFVTAPESVTIEDVLVPEFWTHCARMLRPCDEIKVYSESGKFRLHLHVRAVSRVAARVDVLSRHEFKVEGSAVEVLGDKYTVKWRSPQSRYAVYRVADNSLVKDRFQSEDDAYTYIRDLDRTLAA